MDKKDWVFALVALSIAADISITLSFWEYESNPIVLALGQANFSWIKIMLIIGLYASWYKFRAYEARSGWMLMGLLTSFHLIVLALNLVVITA